MSNNRKKFVKQISLFEMIQKDNQSKEIVKSGSLNFSEEYAMVLKRCYSNSGLSAVAFAGNMTELLNRGFPDDPTITHNMIYSWESPAKPEYEPKPSWLPAFCQIGGSVEPIEFLVRKVNHFMMPGDDALRSEVQKLDEQIKKLQEAKEERLLFLKIKNKK